MQQVRQVTNGQAITLQGVATFANDGPSTSLGGTVALSAGGDGQTILVEPLTHGTGPLTDCKLEQPQKHVHLPGTAVGSPGFDQRHGRHEGQHRLLPERRRQADHFQWSITRPGLDPKGGNNTAQTVAILCAPGATEAPCNG